MPQSQLIFTCNYRPPIRLSINRKTGAGHLPVSIFGSSKELLVKMTQGRVEFLSPFNESQRTELASALGVSESDFADLPIQVVTTGHSKVMVPMLSRNKLDELIPNNKN